MSSSRLEWPSSLLLGRRVALSSFGSGSSFPLITAGEGVGAFDFQADEAAVVGEDVLSAFGIDFEGTP